MCNQSQSEGSVSNHLKAVSDCLVQPPTLSVAEYEVEECTELTSVHLTKSATAQQIICIGTGHVMGIK